ncbi:UDP-glucose dehydrogenase family protein [Peribacillus frigoritolerans]|uniref:UDP-glucose dehydrogenase family protein n=1 Tax=Peribacillus frigoritolerans TaxID=450367 RepID=UPI003305AC42
MSKIAVVGTGYVGLVTGVALSEVGHCVTCVDIDKNKVEKMNMGITPIYEPGLGEMMKTNIEKDNLTFTTDYQQAFQGAVAIYIAVGTPENADGSANLKYIEQATKTIAKYAPTNTIVVVKSTVPVGTNHKVQAIIDEVVGEEKQVKVVSNPEFLREGSALHDAFHGDRIVIGADDSAAADVLEKINQPFGIPILKTDIRSAEMIKYASNAFLATKISFINEIANICEKVDADIEEVGKGMGLDQRIGTMFLNAGIGYGGSCFPKDTKALSKIASYVELDFHLLKSVIEVNAKQQRKLISLANERFGSLKGKKVAILGLSFKPNTDDMREAPSIVIARELVELGALVKAYDPIAINNAKEWLPNCIEYVQTKEEALAEADCVFILTEWDEFKDMSLSLFSEKMKQPIVFDGRNCFPLERVEDYSMEYYSIGRRKVLCLKADSNR